MPSNIHNNNTRDINLHLIYDKYYDFMLFKGQCHNDGVGMKKDCLCGYIDANFAECTSEDGRIYSTTTWADAVNDGVQLGNIGYTGVDNGFIHFEKDRTDNEQFLNLFTGSTLDIKEGDMRLFLTPVTGNTQRYTYYVGLGGDENEKYYSFQGGFYQGFYKLYGHNYQTLPNTIDNDWHMEFTLRRRGDYDLDYNIVNNIHPENAGIFFYMGTRAENKFAEIYNGTYKGFTGQTTPVTEDYFGVEPDEPEIIEKPTNTYFDPDDGYFSPDYVEAPLPEYHDLSCGNPIPAKADESYFDLSDGYVANIRKEWNLVTEEIKTRLHNEKAMAMESGNLVTTWDKKGCACGDKFVPNEKGHHHHPHHGHHHHHMHAPHGFTAFLYDVYDENSTECYSCGPHKEMKPCGHCHHKVPMRGCHIFLPAADYAVNDNYFMASTCVNDGVISREAVDYELDITKVTVMTTDGHPGDERGYYEFNSDNKYLLFDHTKDGVTTHTYEEGMEALISGYKREYNDNAFVLFNHTPTGLTAKNADMYLDSILSEYKINKDTKNNAFALKMNDDGSMSYRYMIKDCNEESGYRIEEEFTKPNLIPDNEWVTINVRFHIDGNNMVDRCGKSIKQNNRNIRILIYINGNLVFISKELPNFDFRELNEIASKQEGVPYNISLGGGTQGLMERIWFDYYDIPTEIYDLEKNFAGTFIGDIKSFKFYNCEMTYGEINNNHKSEQNLV